jgi:predicted O-methyltransferase YrrM
VYSSTQLATKFFQYYLAAFNSKGHGMHSPFVFDFILHVLNNKKGYEAPAAVEALRKQLTQNKKQILIEDLGAGSRAGVSKQKTIKQLATTAVKPKKYGHVLYRLAKHYQPQTIIELGTSLGITTSYLAFANPAANIITIEGSEQIHAIAKENFYQLKLDGVKALKGNFDDLLPQVLQNIDRVDLGYVDGNHRYQPTMNYFHQLLQKKDNDSILVFDDIHWSVEMEKAWEEIKAHPAVRCTIDIFFLGFVFFRDEFKEKLDFTIRF